MKQTPESKVQQQIYTFVNNSYCLAHYVPSLVCHSVPNGVGFNIPAQIPSSLHKFVRQAIGMSVDLLKKTGQVDGIADMMIHGVIGRCIWVEVKTDIGKQSPAQIKMQNKIDSLGGVYLLVRSLEDFQQQFQPHIEWLKNPAI